jgi:hypothetical protein
MVEDCQMVVEDCRMEVEDSPMEVEDSLKVEVGCLMEVEEFVLILVHLRKIPLFSQNYQHLEE